MATKKSKPTASNQERARPGAPTEIVTLADEEGVRQVVAESVLSLWDVVNSLTRLRPSRRERYCVTIFGSARLSPGTFGYEETKRASAALARMGCDIVTGGGPGLMQAANEGAAHGSKRARSLGIRVHLPFEQASNAFVTDLFEHRTLFTRLHQFVLTSDAFVVAPGGIGTLLEMVLIWQLLQVRHLMDAPLVLVGEMWPGLVAWAREEMLASDPPLAGHADFGIPRCVPDADAAIEVIRGHYERWKRANGRASDERQVVPARSDARATSKARRRRRIEGKI
jgi:uncharacterized protein (TIGR00730 family)